MNKTPLYSYHIQKAKMAPFAGFEMPLFYTGALAEVKAVREGAGLFDVSHMGVIEIAGEEAESFLDWVSTNQIKGKKTGSATYTVLCSKEGGCIDDVMVMKVSDSNFLVVANASNRDVVLSHFKQEAARFKSVSVHSLFDTHGLLALQGKTAADVLKEIIPGALNLKKHTLANEKHHEFGPLALSRTGYTGEDGFEILISFKTMRSLWDTILSQRQVIPCGLAARDILRLEMGYALFGHELSPTISPLESVSFWTVKMQKERFLGKDALMNWPTSRCEQGIVLSSKGVMREGYAVFKEDTNVGVITSGGFSPTLGKSVGIALLNSKLAIGDRVTIEIRGKKEPGEIVSLPFIHHQAS
ncbi:glycine cleavage system aminomethyltransferase GcvT [Estrella lausannensis]|uniref:aminomethyltransferase n=1 Tax=Estrella lausannensis TaxID=483423 RepID=A0A0H5DNA1_9BACT|nr:glycine cleavage system aminomethyltransferase GcvT [Estrella lausannensis]CRX37602.1 Glycine cleavage system T protein [Estrella lausannensis]